MYRSRVPWNLPGLFSPPVLPAPASDSVKIGKVFETEKLFSDIF
jgi:hypothetical protein